MKLLHLSLFSSLCLSAMATPTLAGLPNNPSKNVMSFFKQLFGSTDDQTPFDIHSINEDYLNENHKAPVHFSKYDAEKWPINLYQYSRQVVLRIPVQVRLDRLAIGNALRQLSWYDIWATNRKFTDVRIFEHELEFFKQLLPFGETVTEMIDDLQQTVFETYSDPKSKNEYSITKKNEGSIELMELFFKDFRDLETIYNWLDLLEKSYPDLVSVVDAGETYEGRPHKFVHVFAQGDNFGSDKKTIVINGGTHAREWISVTSVLYSLYNLVSRYGKKKLETEYLDSLDFVFIPVNNPDGYAYTWEHDRLWRKNRQPTYSPKCFGVDIDHSYGYKWQQSVDLACGEDYSGETAFAAIETIHWAKFINDSEQQRVHKVYGYLDWHSYSEEILYPYAYSCEEEPRDLENLQELAYGLAKAVRLTSGKHYNVLPACEDRDSYNGEDTGGGSSLDFMYHSHALWAFQLKLRDSGTHGFLLPKKFIIPVANEAYQTLKYMCSFLLDSHP